MAKKRKYYVVWQGNTPGIYDSWTECQLQTKGYPGAKFKSYPTRAQAEDAYGSGPEQRAKSDSVLYRKRVPDLPEEMPIEWDSLSVDAACSGNPGAMEYRGVNTRNGDVIFHQGPFKAGTNNVGEFLALVHALAYLKKVGDQKTPVYSDSRIAIGWVRKKKSKSTMRRTKGNLKLFELIARAEKWLACETYKTRILKWETKEWGEIPADFGRK